MIHVKSSKYYKSDSVFKVGVYGAEVTPVPIPNTEVKLCREDDTWLVTARETISMPTQYQTEVMCFRLFIWANSSVGQSIRLITGRSGVRVPVGPPSDPEIWIAFLFIFSGLMHIYVSVLSVLYIFKCFIAI